jgi:hypothetical protein
MKLCDSTLCDFFPLLDKSNSHYTQPYCPYTFVDRKSNQLVVTVGASWTWGNFVPVEFSNNTIDKTLHQHRVKHIYGNIISEQLHADFLNLAANGASNFWAAARIGNLLDIADQLHYDKIYLIWTSTDPGKGFNSHEDLHIDYKEIFSVISSNKMSFDFLLEQMNKQTLDTILCKIQNNNKILFRVGTDRVDSIGFSQLTPLQLLPVWARSPDSKESCYIVDRAAVDRLQTALDDFILDAESNTKFKNCIIKWVDQANTRRSQISTHAEHLFPIKNQQHPNEAAHVCWANTILGTL